MLFLIFSVGANNYALDCDFILEIIPKVDLQKLSCTPSPYHSGLLNYGGVPLPVVDVRYLIEKKESDSAMHTRIVVLQSNVCASVYGLICERATTVMNLKKEDFKLPTMKTKSLPFLGGIQTINNQILQLFNPDELLKELLEMKEIFA